MTTTYSKKMARTRLDDILYMLWITTSALESRCEPGDILDKGTVSAAYNVFNDVGYTDGRPHWETAPIPGHSNEAAHKGFQALARRIAKAPLRRGESANGVRSTLGLPPRETQVLEELARGATIAAIATKLGTSPKTVCNQLTSIYRKLGVNNKVEATLAYQRLVK